MPKAESVLSTPPETVSETPPPPTRRATLAALAWTGTVALSGAVLFHGVADAAEAAAPARTVPSRLETQPMRKSSETRIMGTCQRPDPCPCFDPCHYWVRANDDVARGLWPDFRHDDDGEDA